MSVTATPLPPPGSGTPDVQQVTVVARKPPSDDVLLVLDNGQRLGGWTEARITRGIERCPADFALVVTEKYPLSVDALQVRAGQDIQLFIGADIVLSGYVDVVRPRISADTHSVTILGRGLCQDLVDCSAEWPGGQIQNATVEAIAAKLAAPYGIRVTALDDPGDPIPLYQINIGETVWEIIEKVCRYRQLLAYDDTDGNLLLAKVSKVQGKSGFQEGVNVLEAEAALSAHQRYSEYQSYTMSTESFNDLGAVDYTSKTVTDSAVKRHRVRKVVCPVSGPLGTAFAEDRIIWEMARRAGRSYAVSLTTDAWRDVQGLLYTPNTQVRLQLPSLKLPDVTWTISEVTFHKGAGGTSCDVLLMPPQAFIPEPDISFQLPAELIQELPAQAGAAPSQ